MKRSLVLLLALCVVLASMLGCGRRGGVNVGDAGDADLSIVSGSENESLEPLIHQFANDNGYDIQMTYMGSVDMMLGMGSPDFPYDAVWPAHSLWIALGDQDLKRVKHVESIMRSPVVFGIKKSLAEDLGFVGREVTVGDILEATESGALRFMMTNATQSNSGATAYLGFLYSFLGNPDVITEEMLNDPQLREKMVKLLSAVNRSSGSSGWLKDLYLTSDQRYDALVNYEALMIEINQELEHQGQEPLWVVYPVDGQAIADSPLGYVDRGDDEKERIFLELQEYLLSQETQSELLAHGRRTGLVGLSTERFPKDVFRPEWGIDTERIINQIRLPQPDVIRSALDMYQLAFRKPSFTVFALDYSGSMSGKGERALEAAMAFLLDQENAQRYLIQTGPQDVIVVIPFNSNPLDVWMVRGNDQEALDDLLQRIRNREPNDGTNIYRPVIEALRVMTQQMPGPEAYQPAVILMSDGRSASEREMRVLTQAWEDVGWDVPVFSIMFGDADPDQLEDIAALTRARVFDGTEDLVEAFRNAKGYN